MRRGCLPGNACRAQNNEMAGTNKLRPLDSRPLSGASSVFFCLLLAANLILAGCGMKGEPTLKAYEKPPAPTELTAVHRESELILSWTFPKGKEQSIKGFYLMKSEGGDFKRLPFIKNDKRSLADTDFETGRTYKYKIVSENLKGMTSIDSNVLEIKPETPPAAPEDISYAIEYDTLTLSWRSAGEGVLYNVYKSSSPGTYLLAPLNSEPLRTTTLKDAFSLKNPVYYTIRSLIGGAVRDEGPASQEIGINPSALVPQAPAGVQAVATKENVTLIWKEPRETWITGYRVYRETRKDEGYTLIGESQTPSFIDKDSPATKRSYRVTALGPSMEGPPAEIRDVIYKE